MKVCRKFFNLVEITLAMAVVGIGVAGIMAMFPPAVEASRNAIAENYAVDASNTMMAYIEQYVKKDWGTTLSSATYFPSAATVIPADNQVFDLSSWVENGVTTPVVTAMNGVYGVRNGNDFAAHMRIWTTTVPDFYNPDVPATPISLGNYPTYDYGVRIYMELSWPVMKKYSEREKKVYVMELRKPNP